VDMVFSGAGRALSEIHWPVVASARIGEVQSRKCGSREDVDSSRPIWRACGARLVFHCRAPVWILRGGAADGGSFFRVVAVSLFGETGFSERLFGRIFPFTICLDVGGFWF